MGIRANLDLLEEVREDASLRATARQRHVAQYFNKKVKVKRFEERDLVLRNCRTSRPVNEQRKLSSSWEGPYLDSTMIENMGYKLQMIEGKEILNT